jgi:hypothetical protein
MLICHVGPRSELVILGSNPEINMTTQKEILHVLQTVIEQNYFQVDQQYYNPVFLNRMQLL